MRRASAEARGYHFDLATTDRQSLCKRDGISINSWEGCDQVRTKSQGDQSDPNLGRERHLHVLRCSTGHPRLSSPLALVCESGVRLLFFGRPAPPPTRSDPYSTSSAQIRVRAESVPLRLCHHPE